MGKGDKRRPQQVSNEEVDLRWRQMTTKRKLSKHEFDKMITEIRKRTKKP